MRSLVILPIIPWNDVIVQRPHHLAKQFVLNGFHVHYIDAHRRGKGLQTKELDTGVTGYTLPWAMYKDFLTGKNHATEMCRSIEQRNPDVILVNAPYWADVAIQLQESTGAKLVYDVLDHYEGFKDLQKMGKLGESHLRLVEHADLITHTAHVLKPEKCKESLYLPNACDFKHWNMGRKPGGRPGYFGTKSHWFDEDAAATIKGLEIIGPGSEKGKIAYQNLPRLAKRWGVGVIPFLPMRLTQSTNPVKFYEYMALGLPVVATDLEEIRQISDSMPEEIRPYLVTSLDVWADAVALAIEEDTEELISGRKEWAETQTWKDRYRAIISVIENGNPLAPGCKVELSLDGDLVLNGANHEDDCSDTGQLQGA